MNQMAVTPDANTAYPESDIPTTAGIQLNAVQIRRLRWYHQRGNSKSHAHGDVTDLDLLRVGAINHGQSHSYDYVRITKNESHLDNISISGT